MHRKIVVNGERSEWKRDARHTKESIDSGSYLGVLVRLGTEKGLAVSHGNGFLQPLFETLKLAKVGLGVHETSADSVGVASNGSNNATARILGTRHVVEKKVNQQKVSQVVDTHTHLKAVVRPGRFRVRRQVNGSIADKVVQGASRLEGFEVSHKVTHTLQVAQFELHGNIGVVWHAHFLGDCKNQASVRRRNLQCEKQYLKCNQTP